MIVEGLHLFCNLDRTPEYRKSAKRPRHAADPRPKNCEVFEVRDEDQVLIAHHDQVPVLVGTDPTIKALIVVGDALVSRAEISVGRMLCKGF